MIVIADSGNWDIGEPALTTSLRGLVRADIEVRTLGHAVHSGMWGGLVPDAIMTLSRVISSLYDDAGKVAVQGLFSGPAADVEYPEERLRAESGAHGSIEWIGDGPVVERLWTQPALTVTGLDAPKVDGASNTLVPMARAKLSLRIAPGDTTANAVECLRKHCEANVPWGAQLTFTVVDTGEPTQIDATGPAYDAARAAFQEAWDGVAPVDMGVGGSIPFIAEFLEAFPEASRAGHRRRGPRHPRPRRQRGPPPRRVRARRPRRGPPAAQPRGGIVRDDGPVDWLWPNVTDYPAASRCA